MLANESNIAANKGPTYGMVMLLLRTSGVFNLIRAEPAAE